jgi:plasmid stabilization system protein ParE
MNLEFLPEARRDIFEAVEYFESRKTGLGARFRNEIAGILNHVASAPTLWRERPGGYRRANCPVFPYYIAYFIRGNSIIVAAIAHGHRLPEFWKQRKMS